MLDLDPKKEVKDVWWRPGMMLFFNIIGLIAGPVIIAVLVGKWLDDKYETSPWILLILVFVAFVFSMIGIVKETNKVIKQIDKDEKEACPPDADAARDKKEGNKK